MRNGFLDPNCQCCQASLTVQVNAGIYENQPELKQYVLGVAVSPDGYYLYIVGGTEGYLKEDTYVTSNIFKMQCENYDCTLDTTGLHLKDVRRASTVIFVKEHWLQCYYE